MDLKCLNSIIENGLAVHIDLTDIDSWNLNTDFTSISLNQWSEAKSDNLFLYDFGLTAFDNGRVSKMYDTLTLTPNDTRLTLYRVGYNTATGGTFYDGYEISGVTGNTVTGQTYVGNHFNLSGGYLQGFFKLYNYNYEILPARFNNGVTIETIIRIDNESFSNNGIIYLMGERAEDKYNKFFTGETTQLSPILTSTLTNEVIQYLPASNAYSGVTTGEDNFLAAYKTGDTTPKTIPNMDNKEVSSFIIQPQTSINGNVISLFLNSNGALGFKYINDDGVVLNRFSDGKIAKTGWTIITLAFKPYETFDDPELLLCAPRRKGDFMVFVNGRQFWKITNFDEFFFTNMKNQKEKQLGVPYNVSWGGGSFGLRHSWHYDFKTYELFNGNDQTYIDSNFIQKTNPLNDDPCIVHVTGSSATTGVQLLSNSTSFFVEDECDPSVHIPVVVMEIDRLTTLTGSTATTNSYYFEYDRPLEILSNREYVFTAKIYDAGIFETYDPVSLDPITSKMEILVYGTVDIEVVSETSYSGGTGGKWITISKTIKLADKTGLQTVFVGISLESTIPLIEDFKFYVDDFMYRGSDILIQDPTKENLTMESNFSNSFIGGIQKLRIYDYAFNSEQALHNAFWESKGNRGLNINVTRGGRIIYRS